MEKRIDSAMATVAAYDSDPSLLTYARSQIPIAKLLASALQYPSHQYPSHQYPSHSRDISFARALLSWFKADFFTWTNKPKCTTPNCNSDGAERTCTHTRGPQTSSERSGLASRVEVYTCSKCNNAAITFPRYNDPRTLLAYRRGRCGEFANCFGLLVTSLGFDARYVLDLTDHVWVEVYDVVRDCWVCMDSCEDKMDHPGMYENGWGKKLSYVIAVSREGVCDVTRRYSRLTHTKEMKERRNMISEGELVTMIKQKNAIQRSRWKCNESRRAELDRRADLEEQYFTQTVIDGRKGGDAAWGDATEKFEGRISGDA